MNLLNVDRLSSVWFVSFIFINIHLVALNWEYLFMCRRNLGTCLNEMMIKSWHSLFDSYLEVNSWFCKGINSCKRCEGLSIILEFGVYLYPTHVICNPWFLIVCTALSGLRKTCRYLYLQYNVIYFLRNV